MATLKPEFLDRMRREMPGDADALAAALTGTAPSVSIRLNRLKPARPAIEAERVPWCDEGFYLDERPQFTFDPFLHAGCYYVQDASSMFISHAIRHIATGERPLAYLDLCAAPGGKSTAAINALPPGSLVVANEIDRRRVQILCENVVKWGGADCVVTNTDAHTLGHLRSSFDIIAADMPCSGEGMMRKDEEAAAQWSEALVAECAGRQKEIAADIWDALRPGGHFIYSTCTFNRSEDEDVAEYIATELGGEAVEIPINDTCGIAESRTAHSCGYRFMPHRTRGEGLYMAVFRKPGETTVEGDKGKRRDKSKAQKNAECLGWLKNADDYTLTSVGEEIRAIPKRHAEFVRSIAKTCRTLHTGVPLAVVKGRDIVPVHALALSAAMRDDAFPNVDLSYVEAIAYLRGETLTPADAPRGYLTVSYRDRRLGFIKNLGMRANNCYPKEWRIRSLSTPTDPVVIVK